MAGDNKRAINYMRGGLGNDQDWNDYVLATIAFLSNNKRQFQQYANRPNSNSETIKKLAANWGKTYKEAY
jgi:hypothetical protein